MTKKMPEAPLQEASEPLDYAQLRRGRYRFSYVVTQTADGGRLAIPVLVIVGATPGPRLGCVAGVHGNEHDGVTALLELWDELSPSAIAGTLVMVPSANPPAFRACERRNPEDLTDMNRVFPGRPDGNTTEVLAHGLVSGILAGSDLVLSMHGWTEDGMVVPYTEYPKDLPTTDASRAAALVFGLPYVEAYDWPHGLLGAALARIGVPAIEPEIGGLGTTGVERRALYKGGVVNLLKHLGMQPGEPQLPASVSHVERHALHAPVGGVIRRNLELGDPVKAGERVATITDLTGETLAVLDSRLEGFIAIQRLRASVSPGDLVAVVFRPSSAGGEKES